MIAETGITMMEDLENRKRFLQTTLVIWGADVVPTIHQLGFQELTDDVFTLLRHTEYLALRLTVADNDPGEYYDCPVMQHALHELAKHEGHLVPIYAQKQ